MLDLQELAHSLPDGPLVEYPRALGGEEARLHVHLADAEVVPEEVIDEAECAARRRFVAAHVEVIYDLASLLVL